MTALEISPVILFRERARFAPPDGPPPPLRPEIHRQDLAAADLVWALHHAMSDPGANPANRKRAKARLLGLFTTPESSLNGRSECARGRIIS